MKRLLAPLALLILTACSGPAVVPHSQAEKFSLGLLKSQKIAVWPVASADLDESTTKTVGDEYSNRNKFLDAFSSKLSTKLLTLTHPGSLPSEKIVEVLSGDITQKSLLDPSQLLGAQDPNNRFATQTQPAGINLLPQISVLKDIRYLVIPRDISLGRQWSHNTSGGGFVSTGNGGGMFLGGGGSSAKTRARLRLAIIDLDTKSLVWDGSIFADASSSFMKASALHEVEDDLVSNFANEVLGIK